MLIGHFSDLHGRLDGLRATTEKPDVWVNTGDFFPDHPLGGCAATWEAERLYQKKWFHGVRRSFLERLGGAPLLTCPGNHDRHNLARLLVHLYPVTEVTPEGVELVGLRWAGFGYTPLECPQEVLAQLVRRSLAARPHVLVTHAPPSGILCHEDPAWGIQSLPRALREATPPPRYHLYGHVHQDGGRTQVGSAGTRFYNGACRVRFIEIDGEPGEPAP